jgi:hypothetical protein
MVYVDLNPVRAGIADDVGDSDFTSVQRRLAYDREEESIAAINGNRCPSPFAQMSLADYVNLVRWTAKAQSLRRRSIQSGVGRSLRINHATYDSWFRDNLPKPHRWQRAMGSRDALQEYAKVVGQCWIKRQLTKP